MTKFSHTNFHLSVVQSITYGSQCQCLTHLDARYAKGIGGGIQTPFPQGWLVHPPFIVFGRHLRASPVGSRIKLMFEYTYV